MSKDEHERTAIAYLSESFFTSQGWSLGGDGWPGDWHVANLLDGSDHWIIRVIIRVVRVFRSENIAHRIFRPVEMNRKLRRKTD